MNNFSRLEQEHPNFLKLPKLPYVIGADKAFILALSKQISDNQSPVFAERFSVSDIIALYDRIFNEHNIHHAEEEYPLSAYKFAKGQCADFPVDYAKNLDIINNLQPDEYEQLVETMAKYWELEVKLKPRK